MTGASEVWPLRELARSLHTQAQQDSHRRLEKIFRSNARSTEKTATVQG